MYTAKKKKARNIRSKYTNTRPVSSQHLSNIKKDTIHPSPILSSKHSSTNHTPLPATNITLPSSRRQTSHTPLGRFHSRRTPSFRTMFRSVFAVMAMTPMFRFPALATPASISISASVPLFFFVFVVSSGGDANAGYTVRRQYSLGIWGAEKHIVVVVVGWECYVRS